MPVWVLGRERPHPGAQLTLFEVGDGWRYSLRATSRPAATRGWLGQNAYLDAAHRVHARVEDAVRTGKDCGIGKFPSGSLAMHKAWQAAALTAAALLAWLRLLALDGHLAKAGPVEPQPPARQPGHRYPPEPRNKAHKRPARPRQPRSASP